MLESRIVNNIVWIPCTYSFPLSTFVTVTTGNAPTANGRSRMSAGFAFRFRDLS